MSLAFQAGHTVAFLWGIYGISKGTVTYGMMTAFLQLVGQIQRPLVEMSSQIPAVIHATASIDRIMEIKKKAEATIFKGEDLCLATIIKDTSIDFGEYSLGRGLKRELIGMEVL
jgi:ABC-type multidrug transport system fused ATPase/permease subunit